MRVGWLDQRQSETSSPRNHHYIVLFQTIAQWAQQVAEIIRKSHLRILHTLGSSDRDAWERYYASFDALLFSYKSLSFVQDPSQCPTEKRNLSQFLETRISSILLAAEEEVLIIIRQKQQQYTSSATFMVSNFANKTSLSLLILFRWMAAESVKEQANGHNEKGQTAGKDGALV